MILKSASSFHSLEFNLDLCTYKIVLEECYDFILQRIKHSTRVHTKLFWNSAMALFYCGSSIRR